MGLFYQNLIRFNPQTFEPEPEIAQRWEQPSDREYIFRIGDGIRWHDKPPINGRALTASDVVFSLRRLGTNEARFVNKTLVANVDRIEAPDNATVRVITKQPDVTTLKNLADWTALILAPEVVEGAGSFASADTAVGTGAFVLKSSDDSSATLVRNPNYWKSGLPYLDEVNLVTLADPQAQWSAFLSERLDVVLVPGTEVEKLLGQREKRVSTAWFKDILSHPLWQNTKSKPFDDPRVTRALRLMMDHSEFTKAWGEVWFGPGSSVLMSHLPHALDAWDFTQDEYSQARTPLFLEWKQPKDDAAKEALALLAAAGFTRENPLKFDLGTISLSWVQPMAELMQSQWRRFGQGIVQADLKIHDLNVLRTMQARGEFQVVGPLARGTAIDPDQIRQYYHSAGGNNFGKYSDPKVDEMIDRQRTIFDAAQRKTAVKELLTYLIQNAPYVGPGSADVLNAVQPRVKNYVPELDTAIFGFQYEHVWLDS